jgi:hypothetical protein
MLNAVNGEGRQRIKMPGGEEEAEIFEPSQWFCANVDAADTRCHHSHIGSTINRKAT